MTVLTDLRVGDAIVLALRVTTRDASGLGCNLYTTGKTVQGTVQLAPDQSIVGAFANPPGLVPVSVLGRAFGVGDVVMNDQTGETLVVRAVWIGPAGWEWSSSTSKGSTYSTDGWTMIGTAAFT